MGTISGIRPLRHARKIPLEEVPQRLAVLNRKHPQPRLFGSEKLFWVLLRRPWCGWKQALLIVQPETVVRWHSIGALMAE
jgi:hypothetical protein